MSDAAAGTKAPRRLPGLNKDNRAFWTGGAGGRLMICRCIACGVYVHPPLPHCTVCDRAPTEPVAVSGRGKVASFSVNQQAWLPGMEVPFVFAAVELEEQAELYLFTNIVGCPPEDVDFGMPVEVEFEQQEDVYLPLFRPRKDAR